MKRICLRLKTGWLILGLLLSAALSYGQVDCSNVGFEQGNTIGWVLTNGEVANLNQQVIYQNETVGTFENGHLITKVSDGNDPNITNDAIPMVAPGSTYSLRIGNVTRGSRFDRIKGTFLVTPDNNLLQYKFAVILQNPDHQSYEQPEFNIRVTDKNGTVIGCNYYNVTASGSIDGFKNQGDIRYRNWTTGAVDLRNYVGQTLTIEVTAHGCTKMRHFGYAYFDAQCLKSQVTSLLYCPAVDQFMTLKAPDGFASYAWSTGETTSTIKIKPVKGQKYWVKVVPFSSLSQGCEVQMDYVVNFEEPGEPTLKTVSICEGESYTLGDSTYRKAGTYLTPIKRGVGICDSLVRLTITVKPLARSSQAFTVCEGESVTVGTSVYATTGTYETRFARLGLCDSIVTTNLTVKAIDLKMSRDTIIRPSYSAQLRAMVAGPGNYRYSWSPTTGLSCPTCAVTNANPATTTRYTVTVVDTDLGCSKTASVNVTIGNCTYYVPNVFTPNHDGVNDVFFVQGTDCLVEIRELVIYDRWGEVIFRKQHFPASDPSFGWNGQYLGAESTTGFYPFKIDVEFQNGITSQQYGSIMLMH